MASTERTSRLSPQGRLRCQAAGYASLPALLEARRSIVKPKEISKEFEAELKAQLGGPPTPQQHALVVAATASYTGLYIALQRLRTAHRYSVIAGLIDQTVTLSNSLRRTLCALGLSPKEAVEDSEGDAASALNDYLANRQGARKQ